MRLAEATLTELIRLCFIYLVKNYFLKLTYCTKYYFFVLCNSCMHSGALIILNVGRDDPSDQWIDHIKLPLTTQPRGLKSNPVKKTTV